MNNCCITLSVPMERASFSPIPGILDREDWVLVDPSRRTPGEYSPLISSGICFERVGREQ